MKKIYQMEELECAHCAAKMEDGIKAIPGVTDATVSFFAQKLILVTETDDQTEIIKKARKLIKKIEPDCDIVI